MNQDKRNSRYIVKLLHLTGLLVTVDTLMHSSILHEVAEKTSHSFLSRICCSPPD
ncbi:hypothetical protein PAMP_017245 [Pampus punctatissimus]